MVQFTTKEAENYFDLTRDYEQAKRIDNAMNDARFYLHIGVKHADTRISYENARSDYFKNMEILREYGIFAV